MFHWYFKLREQICTPLLPIKKKVGIPWASIYLSRLAFPESIKKHFFWNQKLVWNQKLLATQVRKRPQQERRELEKKQLLQ